MKLMRTGAALQSKFDNGKLSIDIPAELRTDAVDVVEVR